MRSGVAHMTIPFQVQLFPNFIKFYFSPRSATHLRFQDVIHICDLKVYTHPNQFVSSSDGKYFQCPLPPQPKKNLVTDGRTLATLALIVPLLAPLPASLARVGALAWYIHFISLGTDVSPLLSVASWVPSPSVGVTV
jgi:hypothetical protein